MINDNLLKIITIIEIVYLIYMFIFFKTYYSFNHPYEYIIEYKLSTFFNHSIYKNKYSNKICYFGKYAIILLSLFLLLRYFIYKSNINIIKYTTIIIILLTFMISWLNMNAVIYLIPYYILEFYILYILFNNTKNLQVNSNIIIKL